jgi:hypothetical protein
VVSILATISRARAESGEGRDAFDDGLPGPSVLGDAQAMSKTAAAAARAEAIARAEVEDPRR